MSDYDYSNIASEYDELLKQYQWQAPELLFDYLSKDMQKGERLLDIGVGTGISSQRFHPMGVELYGIDNSTSLLEVCKAKDVFKELHTVDILKENIPYPNTFFEYVVCSGVLHFFASLDHVFVGVTRLLKRDGVFAFTILDSAVDQEQPTSEKREGVEVYYHSAQYIAELSEAHGLELHFEKTFTTLKDLGTKETLDHQLIGLRKK